MKTKAEIRVTKTVTRTISIPFSLREIEAMLSLFAGIAVRDLTEKDVRSTVGKLNGLKKFHEKGMKK